MLQMNRSLGATVLWTALTFSAVPGSARELTDAEKLSDLDQLVSVIQSGYGPLQFKSQRLGLTPEALRNRYATEVRATRSNQEFSYALIRYVAEFKDSHFGASYPSSRTASLPVATEGVGNKVYIENVDRKVLTETAFPFQKGDEVVEIDGVPTEQVVRELMKNIPAGFDRTAWRSAAMALSFRSESRFPLPNGSTTWKIRRGTSGIVDSATLNWTITGTNQLDGPSPTRSILRDSQTGTAARSYDMLSIADNFSDFDNPVAERWFRCSSDTRIQIPANATVLMKAPFVAYYHPTARGNVGYLRIPHYLPVNDITGEPEYALRFSQYEWAVSQLEQNTVGLIIDQDHNCGGSVAYLHQVAGLFFDRPVPTMRFRLLANRGEFLSFQGWRDSANRNTLAWSKMDRVLGLIRTSLANGDFMTPLTSIDGWDMVQPQSVRYTKPIVMLIDEMSGSGGDAFPALLQGNGRAKLLGTRTMGAGGHVQEQPNLFFSQVKLRMTKSLFYRPDGVEVENNGAVPDYPYTLTRDDFMFGYREYQNYYLSVLNSLIP